MFSARCLSTAVNITSILTIVAHSALTIVHSFTFNHTFSQSVLETKDSFLNVKIEKLIFQEEEAHLQNIKHSFN